LTTGDHHRNLQAVKKLVLATLLKLLAVYPRMCSDKASYLAIGVMRAYAMTEDSDPTSEIANKLLALQALAYIARLEHGRDSIKDIQPAVVSVLSGAMNHPSSLLRSAAVEVRNIWFVAGT
jgi:hypothetical protein